MMSGLFELEAQAEKTHNYVLWWSQINPRCLSCPIITYAGEKGAETRSS
jgi:hypothetical protein